MIKSTGNFFRRRWLQLQQADVLACACFFLLPFVFYQKSPAATVTFGHDSFFFFLPANLFSVQSILSFDFPFWNPYNLCGTPFLADMEIAVFYPFNWLFFILSPAVALNLNSLLHIGLAGWLTYRYVTYLGCSRVSAFLGGCAFMFCGFMVEHMVHLSMLQATAWLPLIMLRVERLAECRSTNFTLIGSCALIGALQILAGHPQIPTLTGILVLGRVLCQCFIDSRSAVRLFFSAGTVLLLSLALCAAQLLPTYCYQILSLRSHMSFDFFTEHSFNPLSFILLLFPYFYGSHQQGPYYEPTWCAFVQIPNLLEYTVYAGCAVYLLSAVAVRCCLRKKNVALYLVTGCAAAAMMLGYNNPLYRLVYHIPVLNLFRSPCRYSLLLNFSLAVCAAFGADYVMRACSQASQSLRACRIVCLMWAALLLGCVLLFSFPAALNKLFLLTLVNPDHLPVLQTRTRSLTLANPAIAIPILFMAASLALLWLPVLRPAVARRRLWQAGLVALLLADLFFTCGGFFYDRTASDATALNQRACQDLLAPVLRDQASRSLVEHPYTLRAREMAAALNPNLNMLHRVRMATAENYALFSDDMRQILQLHEQGQNEDAMGLLADNSILSAYAVRYILVSNKSPSFMAPNFIRTGKSSAVAKNIMRDTVLESKGGSWCGISSRVPLDSKALYRISFKAAGDNTKPVHLSLYDLEKEKNLFLHSINQISPGWSLYSKTFCVRESSGTYEAHLYSKSSAPVSVKDITLTRLPFQFVELPQQQQMLYAIRAKDPDSNMVLLENTRALPLVYCVNEVRSLSTFDEFSALVRAAPELWNPAQTAYIENSGLPDWKLGPEQCAPLIVSQGLNSMQISTSSPANHFLVFADTHLPGWRAWIDGKETAIYRTNGILKGVYVPQGKHTVMFRYQAPGFIPGVLISLLAGAALILILYRSGFFRRQRAGV